MKLQKKTLWLIVGGGVILVLLLLTIFYALFSNSSDVVNKPEAVVSVAVHAEVNSPPPSDNNDNATQIVDENELIKSLVGFISLIIAVSIFISVATTLMRTKDD